MKLSVGSINVEETTVGVIQGLNRSGHAFAREIAVQDIRGEVNPGGLVLSRWTHTPIPLIGFFRRIASRVAGATLS